MRAGNGDARLELDSEQAADAILACLQSAEPKLHGQVKLRSVQGSPDCLQTVLQWSQRRTSRCRSAQSHLATSVAVTHGRMRGGWSLPLHMTCQACR